MLLATRKGEDRTMVKMPQLTEEEVQEVVVHAITYLANTPEELGLFLAYSGNGPEDLRAQLHMPSFQAGLLDFLLEQETILLNFAKAEQLKPQDILLARLALPGADQDFKDRCIINTY